jgi:hypothetical protein
MKKIVVIAILFLFVSFFLASHIGLFEIPDSYFYLGLGTYLFTGYVPPVGPFNQVVPQTLFGPVYAIISYPLFRVLQNPLMMVPLLQLVLFGLSAWILVKVIPKILPHSLVRFGVLLFFLLPFNLIYTFFMMSETLAMFLVSLLLYVFVIHRQKKWHASVVVLLCSVLVLTRYAFLPVFGMSLIYWLFTKPSKIVLFVPVAIGLLLIGSWVILHVRLYNTPLLSTFTGRHLYNNVITAGKFIPNNRKSPLVQQFFEYTKTAPKLDVPWWDLQIYFVQPFAEQKMTEVDIDRAFLAVSIQGIKEYPVQYVGHLGRMAYVTFLTPPYHANVLSQLGFVEAECSYCSQRSCRFIWYPQQCQPSQGDSFTQRMFAFYIYGNKAMYPIGSFVLMVLAILGVIQSFFSRKKVLMVIAGLFVVQHLFQSSSEWVEGRFLIPLYPFYVVLILTGIQALLQGFGRLQSFRVQRTTS